ncbi:MAG: Kae1-associated serine/threonine protein kinase [Thermoplasmata archaeon]|jgi:Kae1-associated kinase Bud32|nr:Kae1-associated serine/threonine protein kinase [Thermoplasmata archaeon]
MPETTEEAPVARGAEAALRRVDWWGFPALSKERDAKNYRPKALDDRLRRERTRTEARLLVDARRLGIRTPILYDIDLPRHRLILEELPGPTLKEILEDALQPPEAVARAVRAFGTALGRLHAGGISHGDLTSSNVLFPSGPGGAPAFIDLSMGSRSPGLEELGIDLHLAEGDLKALHPKSEALLRAFYEGYAEGHPSGAKDVRQRAKEIRGRMRYV